MYHEGHYSPTYADDYQDADNAEIAAVTASVHEEQDHEVAAELRQEDEQTGAKRTVVLQIAGSVASQKNAFAFAQKIKQFVPYWVSCRLPMHIEIAEHQEACAMADEDPGPLRAVIEYDANNEESCERYSEIHAYWKFFVDGMYHGFETHNCEGR